MRVMIATERAIYRAGLRMLLEAEDGVRCAGEAASRDEVVQRVSALWACRSLSAIRWLTA